MPGHWHRAGQGPHYFLTYYGEVFHGSPFECPGYDGGFFIIPNHNLKELLDLPDNDNNPEIFRKLGVEIKDSRIFSPGYIPGNTTENSISSYSYPMVNPIEKKCRQLFIFGAGASAFCCSGGSKEKYDSDPYKAPTGYEIFNPNFDPIIKKYPSAIYSIPEFEINGNNIEQCLENEWSRLKTTYNPNLAIQHINLQFYLQELFREISDNVSTNYFRNNLYSLFARRLHEHASYQPNEIYGLVSFNYDTILESFLELGFRVTFNRISDYINHNQYPFILLKPHGSSNWGWKFDMSKVTKTYGKPFHQALYEDGIEPHKLFYELLGDIKSMITSSSYSFDNPTKPTNASRLTLNKQKITVIKNTEKDYYYPALLLPYKDKDEFVMPYDHQLTLELVLKKVEDIFLIGWKGGEDLFNRKLQQHCTNLRRIIIVNPDADAVKKNISKFIDFKSVEIQHINGFEEFVLNKLDNYLA